MVYHNQNPKASRVISCVRGATVVQQKEATSSGAN